LPLCHPPSLPHGAGLSGSGLPLTNRIFSDPAIVIVIGIVIGVVVIVVVAVVVTGRMSRLRREAGGVGAPFQGVPPFKPPRPVPDGLASISFARAGGEKAVRAVRRVVRSVVRGRVVRGRRAGGILPSGPTVPGFKSLTPASGKKASISLSRAGVEVGVRVRAVPSVEIVVISVVVIPSPTGVRPLCAVPRRGGGFCIMKSLRPVPQVPSPTGVRPLCAVPRREGGFRNVCRTIVVRSVVVVVVVTVVPRRAVRTAVVVTAVTAVRTARRVLGPTLVPRVPPTFPPLVVIVHLGGNLAFKNRTMLPST